MQPEELRFMAWQFQKEVDVNRADVVEALENAADYIDHLRDLAARLASQEDQSGYHPFVAEGDGKQVLISVFTEPDGSIGMVNLAFRESQWDTWSPPVEAVKG